MIDANWLRIDLEASAGTTIFASTGAAGTGHPDRMSTHHFYKAVKGSRVTLLDENYFFNIATYSLLFDEKYIYTYSYQEEQSWTTYRQDLSGTTYRQADYVFEEEVYFRICLKRVNGQAFTDAEADRINEIIQFVTVESYYGEKPYFVQEIEQTAHTIADKRTDKSLVLCLLSDTHMTVNGTWNDTSHTIRAVHQKARFDAIVHLGDLTDGMVPARVTRDNVGAIIRDLQQNQIPLYIVLGNHDSNYFASNPEPLTEEEQYDLYQRFNAGFVTGRKMSSFYYVDYEHLSLRLLFLTSYDYREQVRYGYSEELLEWVQNTLEHTPAGFSLLVFSHDAPLAELDYWSETIRNGERLMAILETYGMQDGKEIMALLHGHTHADYIYNDRAFPIVSIGCAKCEYFTDKKPTGSFTQERKLNTVTQELWDTLIVTPSESKIEFVRFGAGEDRTIQGRR